MRVTLYRSLRRQPSMERFARALRLALSRLDSTLHVDLAPPDGFPSSPFHWCKYVSYQRAAKSWAGDVNHVIDHGYAHLVRSLPAASSVVTIHDMGPLWSGRARFGGREGGWRAAAAYAWSIRAMKGAARLVAVTEASRRDLLEYTKWPEDRVSVIHSGIEEHFRPVPAGNEVRGELGLTERRYLLHVGASSARKNLEVVLRGLALLEDDICLAKVGAPLEAPERALAAELGVLPRVIEVGELSDAELPSVYSGAEALVFPSFYEGFGWPPLEAMACGTPAIVSGIPALRETAGPGALVLDDPGSAEELAAAVKKCLRGSSGREHLVARGRERAAEFTWQKTAQAYLDIYKQVGKGAAG
jgi:glycosyltransferase involved in cell wall biosynthesis